MTTKKKCFSSCRGHPYSECNLPRCKYIRGNKYHYCRLSAKYKMNPKSCRVTRKLKKSEIKPHAEKVIQRFLMKHKFNKGKEETNVGVETKNAEKIAKFMKRTTQKRRARFLKSICEDSGVCIAFGKENQKISQFFHHFVNFDFVKNIKRIGSPSANGFVNEIEYKKYNYLAYAVLKSSASERSDNLAYEYLVGQFINKKINFFPCFLQTYGLYHYLSQNKWSHIRITKTIQTNVLKDSLQILDKFDSSVACKNSKYLAILIQHIKNAETLGSFFESDINLPFVTNNLMGVLYQIYFPLSILSSQFTHYDLHTNNVLLYTPVKGSFIHYHYHLNDSTVVEFYSPYIVKIIDYGRSYFKDINNQSSTNLVDNDLCKNTDCDPKCGEDYGFTWFDKKINGDNNFLSAYHNNQSHDLRLMKILDLFLEKQINQRITQLKDNYYFKAYIKPIAKLLQKTKYGIGISNKQNKYYGTKPNIKLGYPRSINNVLDAEKGIREILLNHENKTLLNNNIKNKKKLGDLHVYADGRSMHFVPHV